MKPYLSHIYVIIPYFPNINSPGKENRLHITLISVFLKYFSNFPWKELLILPIYGNCLNSNLKYNRKELYCCGYIYIHINKHSLSFHEGRLKKYILYIKRTCVTDIYYFKRILGQILQKHNAIDPSVKSTCAHIYGRSVNGSTRDKTPRNNTDKEASLDEWATRVTAASRYTSC